MEDENKVLAIAKIVKYILIVSIIGVICFTVFNLYSTSANKKNLSNFFEKSGYKLSNNIWTKKEKVDKNNFISNINYLYNIKDNTYIKNIQNNYDNHLEQINLKYDGTDIISTEYSFDGINELNKNCVLVQNATFNYIDNEFICTVKYNSGSCPLQCERIKKENDYFTKMVQNMIDESKINK